MSVADSIAAALEGRSRLLVLDNCEHVLDAAADLVDAILATSDDGENPGDQQRGTPGGRRTTLACAPLDLHSGSIRALRRYSSTRSGGARRHHVAGR